MIVVLLLIGSVILVSALRNTQGQLASALEQDIPGFLTWAAAILAVGALGFIPGLRTLSRGLLVLVFVVIVVTRYKAILASLTSLSKPVQVAAAVPTDAQVYAAEAGARGGQGASLASVLGNPGAALDQFTQAASAFDVASNAVDIVGSFL